ncbi:hypothetical protein [Saccharomonospora sp. CUA-673]|uniref:hypothetical protein n=1 Tax=Saccharomonospora sp. CUA-673 TaxID=1904969 RepID=UPI000AE98A81|nr:hypothetical protein [Saccharomonospora sp. CUA-673]
MKIAETLQVFASVLGSGQGMVAVLVLSVLAIAAPFADRYLVRRKRLTYRVLYNSKLGINPDVDDEDVTAGVPPGADPAMRRLADEMSRMTSVVVRLRNAGIEDIRPDDLQDHPLTLEFGGRVIWNARISDPSVETHRGAHKRSLRFLPADGAEATRPDAPSAELDEVRKTSRRTFPWTRKAAAVAESVPVPDVPQWTRLQLRDFSLQRKESLKIAIVLREPRAAARIPRTPRTSASRAGSRVAGSSTRRSRRG